MKRIKEEDALRLAQLHEDVRAARAAFNLDPTLDNRERLIMARVRYATLAAVIDAVEA